VGLAEPAPGPAVACRRSSFVYYYEHGWAVVINYVTVRLGAAIHSTVSVQYMNGLHFTVFYFTILYFALLYMRYDSDVDTYLYISATTNAKNDNVS
jgi:hypothetical protein